MSLQSFTDYAVHFQVDLRITDIKENAVTAWKSINTPPSVCPVCAPSDLKIRMQHNMPTAPKC
jgi:hypothetical protein